MKLRSIPIFILTLLVSSSVFAQKWDILKDELIFQSPPFKNCHASTLVETNDGNIIISCFGGTREGASDVAIWNTVYDKMSQQYSPPSKIEDGRINDTSSFPLWNPVLFKRNDGRIFLFYKKGPNPREWSGLYTTSDDNGLSWNKVVALPKDILGAIKNKPIQLENGTVVAPSSVELNSGKWFSTVEISADNCNSWQRYIIDSSHYDVIQPSIIQHKNGSLSVLLRSKQGRILTSSSRDGKTWSPIKKTNLANPNSGIDAVTLKNGGYLIVYNPDVPGRDWWEGRAKLRVAYSKNGKKWKDILILEDKPKGEFSYPSIIQTSDGLVHLTYTYDRVNIKHVVLKKR